MSQVLVKRSLLLLLLVSCMTLPSCWAGVGRQRRVQMSTTTTGAGQTLGVGVPLIQTTIATNDEYFEVPFRRANLAIIPRQQLTQPRHVETNIYADEQPAVQEHSEQSARGHSDLSYANLLSDAKLDPSQWLLINEALSGSKGGDGARHWKFGKDKDDHHKDKDNDSHKPNIIVIPFPQDHHHGHYPHYPHHDHHNHSSTAPATIVNNHNILQMNTTTSSPSSLLPNVPTVPVVPNPPVRSDLLRLPLQYFQMRQESDRNAGLGLGMPYELLAWNDGSSLGGNYAYSSAQSGLGSPYINNMPLVPITLGNNAVGYVPLNLRMYRQLAAKLSDLPIREGEDSVASSSTVLESQPGATSETNEDDSNDDDKTSSSRLQLFAKRLRQGAAADSAGVNPFMAIAKNIRRVQYL